MAAKTRRQKAALAAQTDVDDILPNGNGTVEKTSKKNAALAAQDDVKENVFLFAPNLIGKDSSDSNRRFLFFFFSSRA